MTNNSSQNKTISLKVFVASIIICSLLFLVAGLILGYNKKAQEVKDALSTVLSGLGSTTQNSRLAEEAKTPLPAIEIPIKKELTLQSIKIQINESKILEKLPKTYPEGTFLMPKETTKFAVVNVTITNITKAPLFNPTATIPLGDSSDALFEVFSEGYNYIENKNANVLTYQPNIPESINLVYEIPKSSTPKYISISSKTDNQVYRLLIN